MTYLPASSSILSAAHLGQFLRETYNLSPSASCRLLKAGVNHSYRVTDGVENAVFRVYCFNWRTPLEIREEIRLLTLLHEHNLPVSYPIPDAAGQYIQELDAPEGRRFGVMFSFAEGEKLLTFPEELHETLGQTMAQFHLLTHNQTLARETYTPQVLLVDSVEKLKPFLASDTPEMQFIQTTQRYLLQEFARIDQKAVRKGVVHLDIWFDNLNITPDGVITLFDFDFCGNGLLAFDVAYYILQIHSTETEDEFYKKRDRFLRGYERVTKISAEEKRLIPMLAESIYFFYIGVQCERFDNWSSVFLNELHLKRMINLRMKRWFDFNGLAAG